MTKTKQFAYSFMSQVMRAPRKWHVLLYTTAGVLAGLLCLFAIEAAGYTSTLYSPTLDSWMGATLDHSFLGDLLTWAMNSLPHPGNEHYEYSRLDSTQGLCVLVVLVSLLHALDLVLTLWFCFFTWHAYKAWRNPTTMQKARVLS
jgi:hypothetical protein